MDPLPAALVDLVALWAPRATVVRSHHIDVESELRLRPTRYITLSAEEAACHFDVSRLAALRGEAPRPVGFEDLALYLEEPKGGRPARVRLIFLPQGRLPLEEDPLDWLVGAQLAATGIPLEVLQAAWAISTEHRWFSELLDTLVAEAEHTFPARLNQQRDYLLAFGARLNTLAPLRTALHTWIFGQVAIVLRREDAWYRRRQALALLK